MIRTKCLQCVRLGRLTVAAWSVCKAYAPSLAINLAEAYSDLQSRFPRSGTHSEAINR